MKKYVIYNSHGGLGLPDIFKCGGCIALYKLFHDLNSLGQEVFLSEKPKGSTRGLQDNLIDSNFIKNWYAGDTHMKDCIAIYPEVTVDNPLGCDYVTRWLLHYPGFHNGNCPEKWSPESELYLLTQTG